MTSLWVGLGTAAASLGAGLYSANRAASVQENAADRAAGISQQSSAAQLAFLRQQAAQARNDQLPFLAGGTGAYSEFLRQLGVTPAPVAPTQGAGLSASGMPTTSASGAVLIPLPGITTTGVHSQQTNTSLLRSLAPGVDQAPGAIAPGTRTVTGGGAGQQLFFDRDRRMVIDGEGNLVAQVPQGAGTISGLLHGFNNTVRIDDQGNLVSVGSRGENPLNIRLTGLSAEERAALGTGATGATTGTTTGTGTPATGSDRYGAYFSSPGYKFLYDETMRASKASGAARGSLYSGAMLKELQNRAAGVASQDYGAYMTRLAEASRIGQAAASGTAANANNLGTNGATIIGNAASDQANARLISGSSQASSIIGANNAFQNTLQGGLTALGNYYASRGSSIPNPSTRGPALWNNSWSGP